MLRGISRQFLIDLAKQNNIKVHEVDIRKENLSDLRSLYTATPFCMLPCYKLENYELSFRKKNSLYNQLLSSWSDSVGRH